VDIYKKKRDKKTREIVRTDKVKSDEAIAKEIDDKIESALVQIKDKKYYERYLLAKKEVILIGLAVSTKAQDVKARFERL
jgi:ACT domain-containing protein